MSSTSKGDAPLLLYDGACGLCAASVQFVLRHERRRDLRFAPLDSGTGAAVRARHPELAGVDSMIWVDRPGAPDEAVTVRSSAALRVAWYLGGLWRLTAAGRLVPRPLRDGLYDLVARHRHRLAGGGDRCLMPPPDARARFLA